MIVEAKNQITQSVKPIQIPKMFSGNISLYNDTLIVDHISRITHAKATIFQKFDSGFIRISTTVLKSDGSRAVGTYIPESSPVVQAIKKGEAFKGRAFVVDDWYLTTYHPFTINGKIAGMLFVGIPEKDLSALNNVFSKKVFFTSGYPFILNKEGRVLVNSGKGGEHNEEFLRQLAGMDSDSGKIFSNRDGFEIIQYYKYIPEIDAYTVATVYQHEMMVSVIKLRNAVILAILISLLIILLINYSISKSITSVITKGVLFVKQISEGNLSAKIDVSQQDEIGTLIRSLSDMVDKLRDILAEINQGALEITSASQKINSGAIQLSHGARLQANAADQVSTSMAEMTTAIRQNTSNALDTEKISLRAKQTMGSLSVTGKNSILSMKEIAGKITIVNDIAFQINILALNAAIEAAHADSHGLGFAAVATEIRKLAEKSKSAAEEIAEISQKSFFVTEKADSLINDLMPEIEKTATLVQNITASSQQQHISVENVGNATEDLTQVIQMNVTASKELASSSEILASQAKQLMKAISFFKIK
jgi:methyl-accepting chemotaxis protein